MNVRSWLHGLGAAVIGAAATAGAAAAAAPRDFNFTHQGLIEFAKLLGIPALFAAFAYLKQSPLPSQAAPAAALEATRINVPPNAN